MRVTTYLYAAGAVLLLFMGWKAAWWYADSLALAAAKAEVVAARAALQDEIAKRIEADVHRLSVGSMVDSLEAEFRTTYLTQIRKVPVYVKDNPDCALGPDVVRMFNDANVLPPAGQAGSQR